MLSITWHKSKCTVSRSTQHKSQTENQNAQYLDPHDNICYMTYSVNLRLIITQCLEPQDKNGQERVEMGVDLVSRRRDSDLVAAGGAAAEGGTGAGCRDVGHRKLGFRRAWDDTRRCGRR